MLGVVAAKVAGIDNDAANDSGKAEADDAPVEARRAAAPAFPAVHPLATIRVFALDKDRRACLQQVLFGREKVVIRDENRATQPLRCKID